MYVAYYKELVFMRWLKRPVIKVFFFFLDYEVVVYYYYFGLLDVCVKHCCPTINQNSKKKKKILGLVHYEPQIIELSNRNFQ